MNTIKENNPVEEIDEQLPPKEEKSPLLKATEQQLNFGKSDIARIMPFILFIAFLAIVYIFNSNYSVRTIRESDELAKQIKEYRAEYITVKSEFMYQSKQSQVARRLEVEGLKELRQPPFKISYDPDKDEY